METHSHPDTPLPAISQLPTELLIQVLDWVLPQIYLVSYHWEVRLHSYMRILYTLRLVGKRWQEIIDGTPTFWTFVLSTLPPHVNDAVILRSNNGPLAIVYCAAYGNRAEHHSPGEFLRGIAHTYHRWSAYSGPIVREYLEAPAPLLRHIDLEGSNSDIEPLELLGGYSTSLRYVELINVSIRWSMGLFTQLNALNLRFLGGNGLTTGHLLDFLHASPRLELLMLTVVEAATSDLTYSSPITLSHLRSIKLEACKYGVVMAILSHIRAPSCIEFLVDLSEVTEHDLPTCLEDTLRHFQGPLRAIHEHVGLSEIILEGGGMTWHTPERAEDHRLFLSIECDTPASCIAFVERTIHSDFGLNFHFDYLEDISEAVLEIIAPMRCVTKVEIGETTDTEVTRRILRFLGERCSTQPLLPSLPGLRELKLPFVEWDAKYLMEMVHSRFDALSWDTMERSLLSITMSREAFSWSQPILDYVVLSKIRNTPGVKSIRFSDLGDGKGLVRITWDEAASKPVWG